MKRSSKKNEISEIYQEIEFYKME